MRAAVGACLLSLLGVLGVVHFFPFDESCRSGQLCPAFKHVKGHAYYVPFLAAYSRADEAGKMRSAAELYEDGVRLGPANSDVGEIAEKGHGRFIYFQSSMNLGFYFSTSDNSDPNTNGRTYRVYDPNAVDPYLPPASAPGVVANY